MLVTSVETAFVRIRISSIVAGVVVPAVVAALVGWAAVVPMAIMGALVWSAALPHLPREQLVAFIVWPVASAAIVAMVPYVVRPVLDADSEASPVAAPGLVEALERVIAGLSVGTVTLAGIMVLAASWQLASRRLLG